MPLNFPFLAAALLIGIAFFIIIFKRNLIKLIMGIAMMASGVNLFLVALGYRVGGNAPIYTNVPPGPMVLPVPQALTLTSIVISVAVLALMLTMVIRIYRHTGSLDSEKSRRMKG
ncbi:MAG: cation:proton antiporter [Chloroflexi bacterium RBG_13_51_36]|nr:MAG: cation:proton antiporter [Chloroflexi bacterium RBG_13_51_36]